MGFVRVGARGTSRRTTEKEEDIHFGFSEPPTKEIPPLKKMKP